MVVIKMMKQYTKIIACNNSNISPMLCSTSTEYENAVILIVYMCRVVGLHHYNSKQDFNSNLINR